MTGRSWDTFFRPINGVGALTGANALDVARIGMDKALLTSNVTLLGAAYGQVHLQLVIQNVNRADGIRADGAFGTGNCSGSSKCCLLMLLFFLIKANTMECCIMATMVRISVIKILE